MKNWTISPILVVLAVLVVSSTTPRSAFSADSTATFNGFPLNDSRMIFSVPIVIYYSKSGQSFNGQDYDTYNYNGWTTKSWRDTVTIGKDVIASVAGDTLQLAGPKRSIMIIFDKAQSVIRSFSYYCSNLDREMNMGQNCGIAFSDVPGFSNAEGIHLGDVSYDDWLDRSIVAYSDRFEYRQSHGSFDQGYSQGDSLAGPITLSITQSASRVAGSVESEFLAFTSQGRLHLQFDQDQIVKPVRVSDVLGRMLYMGTATEDFSISIPTSGILLIQVDQEMRKLIIR